ncbi:MAG: YgiQ family radical SAM protein [Chlamydiae bacterium]|nr:MAG: YgiQ family radical SAM protein [Chlamydiota bacterium]
MFIPTTKDEIEKFGWKALDVILVSGDSYIDSPYIGISVIGKVLMKAGFRVGIIAQPDVNSGKDIIRLGEPELFWGVSSGCIDSMVANYTALKKFRKSDDYTPGGKNNRRPDRAVLAYSNLIRRYFKNTAPIVLGGVEASLRRVAHYDYWTNKIRRSILFDAKADYLVYGMAERAIVELAERLLSNKSVNKVRGICYISKEKKGNFIELPGYAEVSQDKNKFSEMFLIFSNNNDPQSAKGLLQKHGDRYLIHNPPAKYLSTEELDEIYELGYERAHSPYYDKSGKVKALETIKFSVSTHRGCYGQCSFCSIAVHEGATVRCRSEESIIKEAREIISLPDFKGYINDVGGPTANMYGFECYKKIKSGICVDKKCLTPEVCSSMNVDHSRQILLLERLRNLTGVKKVFVASGIRYDMILSDKISGEKYLWEIVEHHVSGQIKVAPEHTDDKILKLMNKPGKNILIKFREEFYKITTAVGKNQFLTFYLIAAHPGCTEKDMKDLKFFMNNVMKIQPEQVQIFTPLPSTLSALMYYTEQNPFTGEKLFVEKDGNRKEKQKKIVTKKKHKLI